MGETGRKKRKGRIQKMLTDKDFPQQMTSLVCLQRVSGYLKPEVGDNAPLLTELIAFKPSKP